MSQPILSNAQIQKYEHICEEYIESLETISILLTYSSGLLITEITNPTYTKIILQKEYYTTLSNAFAIATESLKKSTQEKNNFHTMLIEGELVSHYIIQLNSFLLLHLFFYSKTPIGKIRYYANQLRKKLLTTFSNDVLHEDLSEIFNEKNIILLEKEIEKNLKKSNLIK